MKSASREFFFRLCAAGACLAVLIHIAAMMSPALAALEYPPTYPAWRHVVFIAIDSSLAVLFLRRPAWLVWAFAVLTVQILNGHGRAAWITWFEHHRIDWISLAISIAAPIALFVLFLDWRERRRIEPALARAPSR